jgi:Fic family protein
MGAFLFSIQEQQLGIPVSRLSSGYVAKNDIACPTCRQKTENRTGRGIRADLAALYWGFNSLGARPMSTATAVAVCQKSKGTGLDVRRTSGTQLVNEHGDKVVYTPPEGESLLRKLLGNWERFLHDETDLDPLVRMAVGHYQFEAIHPFIDGNGRTGRVLNLLFLIQTGLLRLPVLYLSRAILRNKADYYRLLLKVTRSDAWEPWILFMLRSVEETSRWTTDKVLSVRALADHTAQHVRERLPKLYSRELIDVIFEQPYCRIGNLVDRDIAKRQAASRYLYALVDLGILEEKSVGKEKVFLHPRLLKLLSDDSHRFKLYE